MWQQWQDNCFFCILSPKVLMPFQIPTCAHQRVNNRNSCCWDNSENLKEILSLGGITQIYSMYENNRFKVLTFLISSALLFNFQSILMFTVVRDETYTANASFKHSKGKCAPVHHSGLGHKIGNIWILNPDLCSVFLCTYPILFWGIHQNINLGKFE